MSIAARNVQIIDPRGRTDVPRVKPAARPRTVEGKTVGIIMDGPWRNWYLLAEHLASYLQGCGDVRTKRLSIGNRMDTSGLDLDGVDHIRMHSEDRREDHATALDAFADSVDMVVAGLGN